MNRFNYIMIVLSAVLMLTACYNNESQSDAFGNFEADEIIISAQVGGPLMNYHLEKGQPVEAGVSYALVDTLELALQKRQVAVKKSAGEAQLVGFETQKNIYKERKANLKRDQLRIARMLKEGAATQKQLDDVEGAMAVIDRQVEHVQSQVYALKKELEVLDAQMDVLTDKISRCLIKAPTAGIVLETYKEAAELVVPGQAIFKMANMDALDLRVFLSGTQLSHVKVGQKVSVIIDESETENRRLEGTITWIASDAEFTPKIIQTKEERVKLVYAATIKVQNDGALKIGMPGEIQF